jgi:hypothetical protein
MRTIGDNLSALALIKKTAHHRHTKHIDIFQNEVHKCIVLGESVFKYCRPKICLRMC